MKKIALLLGLLGVISMFGCSKKQDKDNGKKDEPIDEIDDDTPILPLEETSVTPDYAELLRPQYHFTTLDSWNNDPNGLVYFKGEYHMYYQSNPHVNIWGNMTWGHAVSKDLIHWEEKGFSLFPDRVGTMFSGGGFVDVGNRSGFFDTDEGGIIVAYSTDTQHVGIAYSEDGYEFTKLSETKPIIRNPGVADFRDPFIFYHEETEKWVIVLAGGQVRIYTSDDLYNWDLASTNRINTECPSLFPLECEGETKWVLSCCCKNYYVGDFDGETFTPETGPITMTFGPDIYAGINFTNTGKRQIMLSWLNNWAYSTVQTKWNGSMTLPVEFSLEKINGSYKLIQKPVEEYKSLLNKVLIEKTNVSGKDINLDDVSSNQFLLEFEINKSNLKDFDYKFFDGDDGEETVLSYSRNSQTLTFNRLKSGFAKDLNSGQGSYNFKLSDDSFIDGKLKVQLFADVSNAEIFVNDGMYYGAFRAKAFTTSKAMELYANDITFDSFKITSMKSIHFKENKYANAVHLPYDLPKYIAINEEVQIPVASFNGSELNVSSNEYAKVKLEENILFIEGLKAGNGEVRVQAGNHYQLIKFKVYGEGEGTFDSNLGELNCVAGTFTETPFDVSLESTGDGFAISKVKVADVIYDADVSMNKNGAAALLFRYNDNNNFYCLNIDANAQYMKLWKRSGGAVTDLINKQVSLKLNTVYNIKVEARGTEIKCYFDGELAFTKVDTSHSNGLLGINAWNCKATFSRLHYEALSDVVIVHDDNYIEALGALTTTGCTVSEEGNLINFKATGGGDCFALSKVKCKDLEVEGSFKVNNDGAASYLLRADGTTSFYCINIDTGANVVKFWKKVNGAVDVVKTYGVTLNNNTEYKLKVNLVGTLMKIYLNDSLVIEQNDSSLTEGYVGFNIFNTSATLKGFKFTNLDN